MSNYFCREIAEDVRIDFDGANGIISVSKNQSPIPGFHKTWEKIATFTNAKDWDKSPYPELVTSYYIQNMITWFWIDHDASVTQ